jgi:hypothetical protein
MMVGMRRFELPTPSSRTRCATRLRYIPNILCVGSDSGLDLTFIPSVAVNAFGLERIVRHVACYIFRFLALGALDFLLAHFGHFHFHDKVVFAFRAGMIVLRHSFDL